MMLVLRFTLEKLEKSSFQKIITEFFDGTFLYFFFGKFQKMMVGIGLKLLANVRTVTAHWLQTL